MEDITSEQQLKQLLEEGRISEGEYQELLAAMKKSHTVNMQKSATKESDTIMNWYLWSPFQSETSKEICAHMTRDEKRVATIRSGLLGLWIAACFSSPIILLSIAFGRKRSAIAIGIAVIFLITFFISIPIIRKWNKNFLCSTNWAKSKDYTAEDI